MSTSSVSLCSHLQLDLLLQVLVGSLQELLGAQNPVPHHVLGAAPAYEGAASEINSVVLEHLLR